MRTVRNSSRLLGGCLLRGVGVPGPGGVSALGVSAPGGCLLVGGGEVCSALDRQKSDPGIV